MNEKKKIGELSIIAICLNRKKTESVKLWFDTTGDMHK